MSSIRRSGILAGTALALVLTIGASAAQTVEAPKAVEAASPAPETDAKPTTPETQPAAAETKPAAAENPNAAAAAATPAPSAAPAPEKSATDVATPAQSPIQPVKVEASADAPVADKLRDMMGSRLDRILDRKKERPAVEAFYSARSYAPLWVSNGQANARAKAAMAHLATVSADGLDPADYPTPDFRTSDPAALAEAELKLTAEILTYARHAQTGRVHYSRVAADIAYNTEFPEPADILAKVADAKSVEDALDSFNPPHPGYKALKAKLAEVRGQKLDGNAPARLRHGPILKVGMQDARVPLLRQRLGVSGDGETYDKPLADAVKTYQRQHKLSATGTLNGATIESINGPRRDRDADIIIANMERWRWMPRDLGKVHVIVNIPDYTLRVMRDGALYWSTKIVVGKPTQPTPIISAKMQFITVNPTWNVPPSIIQNEYLPALQQDPQALERIGLKVETNRDGTLRIYQPPGERNALGRIRFNFPNKFLVYQHDTPDKNLFAHDKRAYSHGCMRVYDPLKYGEVLLSLALPKEGYTAERLRKMFGSAEQNISFPTPIPVHLTYQTAYVDDAGKLVIREDVYGRDQRLLAILKGDEARVADIPVERRETTISRPVRAPEGFAAAGYGSRFTSDGPTFFERLFGGGQAAYAPPVPPGRINNSRRTYAR